MCSGYSAGSLALSHVKMIPIVINAHIQVYECNTDPASHLCHTVSTLCGILASELSECLAVELPEAPCRTGVSYF